MYSINSVEKSHWQADITQQLDMLISGVARGDAVAPNPETKLGWWGLPDSCSQKLQ